MRTPNPVALQRGLVIVAYFAGKNKQGALRGKSPAGRGGEQAQTLFANANQGKAEDNLFVDGY